MPVFRYIRNLTGITGSIPVADIPVRTDGAPLPSLGDMAMTYLHAHGYDISSILQIFTSYQSSDTVDDFALGLGFQGLPISEGQYIWYMIKRGQQNLSSL
jgi:hypothetical protein